jgi:cell division protein FtsB
MDETAVQDEGVLHDVLQELDKERTRRAELEAQIRDLQLGLADKKSVEEDHQVISRRAFVAMETQVAGYQDIVHAVTSHRPAIAAAAAASPDQFGSSSTIPRRGHKPPVTLPLHVVRLLETIPWDIRAREHIFGREEVYEWQVYDDRDKQWQSQLKYFPVIFKSLPFTKPTPRKAGEDEINAVDHHDDPANIADHPQGHNLLLFLAGGGPDKSASGSRHGVLTDERVSRFLNITSGYPLPQDGGVWEWIGAWRLEKRSPSSALPLNCDKDGWSYGNDTQDFLVKDRRSTNAISDTPGDNNYRKLRRRKWCRQRILVDYLHVSEQTRQYLKLLAENARLQTTSSKICNQLVETKVVLTETEDTLMQTKTDLQKEVNTLKQKITEQDDILKSLKGGSNDDTWDSQVNGVVKNDQANELGSKLTQWVTSSVRKKPLKPKSDLKDVSHKDTLDDTIGQSVGLDESPRSFDWKKLGRGPFRNKVKELQGRKVSFGNSQNAAGELVTGEDNERVAVVSRDLDGSRARSLTS